MKKEAGSVQGNGQGQSRSDNENEGKRRIACWICAKEHSMYDCPIIKNMNAAERRQIMVEKKVCIKCGRKHAGDCNSPRDCRQCPGEQHVDLVCPKKAHTGRPSNNRKRKNEESQ